MAATVRMTDLLYFHRVSLTMSFFSLKEASLGLFIKWQYFKTLRMEVLHAQCSE